MFQKLKIAAISAIVGLGALAAVPATAQADSFYIGIGSHGPSFGYSTVDYRRGWNACSPRDAVRKARRMGVHRAHVRRINRRTINVTGQRHGRFTRVVFSRAPHCPIVRYR